MNDARQLCRIVVSTLAFSPFAVNASVTPGDATSLYNEVRNAAANSTVTVPAGTYMLNATIEPIQSGVSVVGATGNPADVILDGQGACRCLVAKSGATISGLTVRNGYTTSTAGGAGIHATGATVSNCVIDACFVLAAASGGGVYAKSASTVVDCIFSNNVVDVSKGNNKGGGGLCVEDKLTKVEGCEFVGNSATNHVNFLSGGGAVYFAFSDPGDSAIRRCCFIGNRSGYGGAILGVPSLVEDCAFTNNVANCGAVQFISAPNQTSGKQTLHRGTTADGNLFTNGLFCVRGGDLLRMEGCDIGPDNRIFPNSSSHGFLLSKDNIGVADSSFLSMSNCTVRGATSLSTVTRLFGFGQRCSPQVIYGSEFRDTSFSPNDASLLAVGNDAVIANCKFIGNRHTGNNNYSIVDYAGTNIMVRNCLFATNVVGQGFAICIRAQSDNGSRDRNRAVKIDNCTFADNMQRGVTAVYGGMVYVTSNSVVRNCHFFRNVDAWAHPVFWYQWDSAKEGLNATEVRKRFFNCCDANKDHQLAAGENDCVVCTPAEAGIADPDSGLTHDYALAKGSPCVDAGMDLDWIVTNKTRDIRCNRRFKRLYGAKPDIGAWEFSVPLGLLLMVR